MRRVLVVAGLGVVSVVSAGVVWIIRARDAWSQHWADLAAAEREATL